MMAVMKTWKWKCFTEYVHRLCWDQSSIFVIAPLLNRRQKSEKSTVIVSPVSDVGAWSTRVEAC